MFQRASQQTVDAPDAYTFGFILGPRLNAAGRMDSAMVAYELLMTGDRDRAAELAARLEAFNGERRGVEARIAMPASSDAAKTGSAELVRETPISFPRHRITSPHA